MPMIWTLNCFLGFICIVYYNILLYNVFLVLNWLEDLKIWRRKKVAQVVQIGGRGEGGEVIWTKSKRTAVFSRETPLPDWLTWERRVSFCLGRLHKKWNFSGLLRCVRFLLTQFNLIVLQIWYLVLCWCQIVRVLHFLSTNITLTNQQMPRMKSAKRRPMVERIMKNDLSGKG